MFDVETFLFDFFKLPPLANKKQMEEVFRDMAVHTRKLKPSDLLLKRRPNEETHIHEYRLENYEAITYGSMNKALDELYRIVNGIDSKMNIPAETTKEYVQEKNFWRYSFDMYFQKIILKRMVEDPNGLIAWVPTGEGLTDSSKKSNPKPYIVYCGDVVYHDENVCAFLSEEKSPVTYNKKQEYTGDVYWILTTDAFYKIIQDGKKGERSFSIHLIYEHQIGEVPVVTLGGDMTATGYFESFFAPYLAFGNESIRQFSDWQAVMTTSAFPYTEDFALECEVDRIKGETKEIADPDNPDNTINTEEVFKQRMQLRLLPKSPYGSVMRPVKAKTDENWEAVLPPEIPSRRYIHPDVRIAEYSGESWQLLLEKAEDALHLNLGQEDLSGKAKIIDKQSQTSLITKIGNNFFEIETKSLQYVDAYLNYHAIDRSISIDRPDTFEVKTESDIIAEIATLKEKNVPSFFIQQASRDLAKKRFSGNKLGQKIFDTVYVLDPLFIYDTDEKNTMVLANYISKEAVIKSTYIFSLLVKIASDKTPDDFIKMSIEQISVLLDAELKPYYAAIKETPAIPPIN